MKKILFSIAAGLFLSGTAMAQCTSLNGTLSSNQTLSASVCYHLEGCYVIPSGKTLTIPAGTQILCEAGSNLVVERGGTLLATGTATNPIVFTSDQTSGNRAPGDWGGIAFFGNAPNNESVNATRNICTARSFGGSTDNDNSGTLQYVRIEYAGSATNREDAAALLLASVGTGTTIDHVQVSESAADGIYLLGGTVNMQYLLSLNSYKSGFHFSLGNVSKAQFLLDLRKDVAAHVSSGSYGMFIENDLNGSTNTPLTQPLVSNFTGRGPGYCTSPVSTDFHDGIRFDNNGAGNIRNSAIDGWPDNGLFIKDVLSIGNTATIPVNLLDFSNNAVINVTGGLDYDHGAPWTTGCSGSMADWIEEQTSTGCEESGNDFSLTGFGYNADLCDDYCDTRPTLTRSGTALDGTDFSAPFNTFFSNVNYKGALDSTDWTLSWANFCPQTATYCSCDAPLLKTSKASIRFVPNPSTGTTVAYFETDVTGKAELSVLDNITGTILRNKSIRVEHSGKQQISFSVKGLREGVYPVRIEMRDATFTGQIVVR